MVGKGIFVSPWQHSSSCLTLRNTRSQSGQIHLTKFGKHWMVSGSGRRAGVCDGMGGRQALVGEETKGERSAVPPLSTSHPRKWNFLLNTPYQTQNTKFTSQNKKHHKNIKYAIPNTDYTIPNTENTIPNTNRNSNTTVSETCMLWSTSSMLTEAKSAEMRIPALFTKTSKPAECKV